MANAQLSCLGSGFLIVLDYEGSNPSDSSLTVSFPRGTRTVKTSNPSTGLYSGWQAKDDVFNVWHEVTLSPQEIQELKEPVYLLGVKSDVEGVLNSTYFSRELPARCEVLVGTYDAVDVSMISTGKKPVTA
jgi:hypothetical protein